jgi:hypothetical protein
MSDELVIIAGAAVGSILGVLIPLLISRILW